MKFQLLSIFVQDENGNLILSAGSLGKDPSLLTGYVSALEGMGKELSQEVNQNQVNKFKYHDFGENLTILMQKVKGLIFYLVLHTVPPQKVNFLKKFLSSVVELFAEVMEETFELPFSPLSEEEYTTFLHKVALLMTSESWFKNIQLTENYLLSDAGIFMLNFLWNKVIGKINQNLGGGITRLLIQKVNSETKEIIDSSKMVDLQFERGQATPKLVFSEENLENSVYFYSLALKRVLRKIRQGIGGKAFRRFDIFHLSGYSDTT